MTCGRYVCFDACFNGLFTQTRPAEMKMAFNQSDMLCIRSSGVPHFVKRELSRQGVSLSFHSLVPITMSTASVLLFLIGEGFGFSIAHYLYSVALMGVVAAALWGWIGLEHGARTRLVRMIGNRFARKGAA
jgi:hypothetical protein